MRAAWRDHRQMYFNHVSGNRLVNKDDFADLGKGLERRGVDVSGWIPETFLLAYLYLNTQNPENFTQPKLQHESDLRRFG